MHGDLYLAAALAAAVAITVALRAIPFAVKNALRESALIADVGRWMPLGAITILVVYALGSIDVVNWPNGIPEFAGVSSVDPHNGATRRAGISAEPWSASPRRTLPPV
jgi:branched-subunit amino acid transport protein AzlD